MALKKKKSARKSTTRTSSPKKVAPAKKTKKSSRTRVSRAPKITTKNLDDLNERLDIVLPETMFRIAALEHLLVKNQLCSYDELINARQFIQEQESS